MQRVFSLYEEGKLKGQKVHDMTGTTLQKALEGRLAPKLPQFKIFQGLKVLYMHNLYYILHLHTTYYLTYTTSPASIALK